MAVSSKSIVHYTRSLNNLKSIIHDSHLRVKYCTEDVMFYTDDSTGGIAFPMVCFCDLPLTLAKEHIGKYGSYGLGLSKEWARTRKLNPVLYLEPDSILSDYIWKHIQKVIDISDADSENQESESDFQALSQIVGFCKNHAGPLERMGKKRIDNYVFYDEREWRFVPDKAELGEVATMLTSEDYYSNKKHHNNNLRHLNLSFSHNDISYIIVKSDNDIPIIVNCLEARYRSEIPFTELQKLFTKVVSVSQIHNDF